jgi:hypothetical protein
MTLNRKVTNMAPVFPSSSATRFTARFASPVAALAVLVGVALSVPACGSSSDGGGTGASVATLCPLSPKRTMASTAMTAGDFCQLYFQSCIGANEPAGGYKALDDCKTAYTNLAFANTRDCRSYHMCNAVSYDTLSAAAHCGHAVGVGLCADDGSGQ